MAQLFNGSTYYLLAYLLTLTSPVINLHNILAYETNDITFIHCNCTSENNTQKQNNAWKRE